jgi:type IV pilus assembly protein PilC
MGEDTGTLSQILASMANLYEEQLSDMAQGLETLLKPMLTIVMGAIVGWLLISIYLPIVSMSDIVLPHHH